MPFRFVYTARVRKDLQQLPIDLAQRIILSLEELTDPYSHGKKLKGKRQYPLYTHRIGGHRAILSINNNVLLILVLEVSVREPVYRKY